MAIISHRINLDSPVFPLLSELLGRTIIVRGSDQTHPNTFATAIAADPPQLYYAHNVLPTPYGYQSIAFDSFIPGTPIGDFTDIFTLRETATKGAALLGITKSGKALISTLKVPAWQEVGIGGANIRNRIVTTAFIRGITYIYFSNLGCYKYDFAHSTLVPVVLTSLDPTKVLGIVASNGYLIAYTNDAVAWSSILLPTDFTPSLNTGAGGGILEGAQGDIRAAVAIQTGVIFLCANNTVKAAYQNINNFPFRFETIVACGGLSDTRFAATSVLDSNAAYAYTTSGLQAISMQSGEFIVPEVTEFLSGRRLEDYNEVTGAFSVTTPNNVIKKRLAWVADRYLIVSYGDELLTHALVVDTVLSRMGKIKLDHVAVFEFTLFDQTIFETPKRSIGILKSNGQVVVVNTDIVAPNSSGVMLLGKYQYVRERTMELQTVITENIPDRTAFTLSDMPTYDGKTLQPAVPGYLMPSSGLSCQYNFSTNGINHSLLCKGRFNMVSGVISFNIQGKL